MRTRTLLPATLAAALLSGATPAGAMAAPDVVLGAGATTAVEGDAGGGGASFGLALLWPLEDHFRFGVMGLLDDFGVRKDRLIGPGGEDLGPVPGSHRDAFAAVWRMEAHLPSSGVWDGFLTTTWGGYRVTDDLRGVTSRTLNAAGFGLGMGVARRFGPTNAAGLTVRYQQLSRGIPQRYLSACVEWRWQRSAAE